MLLEAVPNFSEGRRPDVCRAIRDTAASEGARILDLTWDPDHHRSVLTYVADLETAVRAAVAVAEIAAALIDLTIHRGNHPRMGAIDVLPFVPLVGATMDDAVRAAREAGRRIGDEVGLPVFLYEHAAARPERRNLADVRRPRFEGLLRLGAIDPDFGPPRAHPTAGAVAVGARLPLVAYNVDLDTADVAVARRIARKVRERDGGLPGLKALGLFLKERGCAQVTMNLVDLEKTDLLAAFRAVEGEAAAEGVRVRSSELIGLVPRAALPPDPVRDLRLEAFRPDRILESRLP